MGKTMCIQNLAKKLTKGHEMRTIPIHGPTLSVENLIKSLSEYSTKEQHCVVHLDIAPSVSNYLNT